MLAKFSELAMTGLISSGQFYLKEAGDIKNVSNGPQKVASYSQSSWIVDNPFLEVRVATLYDLETEVEVI